MNCDIKIWCRTTDKSNPGIDSEEKKILKKIWISKFVPQSSWSLPVLIWQRQKLNQNFYKETTTASTEVIITVQYKLYRLSCCITARSIILPAGWYNYFLCFQRLSRTLPPRLAPQPLYLAVWKVPRKMTKSDLSCGSKKWRRSQYIPWMQEVR